MQYFVGEFNGQTFFSENPKEMVLWADFGADYYAAQSWSDEPNGQRIMIGWQNNWQYANLIQQPPGGCVQFAKSDFLKPTPQGARLFQQLS